MTTRRSRLKAVANLPVRRKVVAFQENSDISTSAVKSSNVPPSPSEKIEGKTINSNFSEHQKDSILSFKKNCFIDSENDNNNEKSTDPIMNCETTNAIISSDKIILSKCEPSEGNEECEKGELINENTINNKSTLSKYRRKIKPNLSSSRTKENFTSSVSKQVDGNLAPTVETLLCPELVNECASKVNEIPNSEMQDTLTLSSIDGDLNNLTNNSSINVITVTSVSDYDEIQNSNQIESRDLFEALPRTVCSEEEKNCEVAEDKVGSEPILTTLVNCSADVSCNLSTLSNGHETELLLASQNEFCINDTCTNAAVIEIINYPDNDGIARSIMSPVRDKGLLDNLMYQEGQDIVSPEVYNPQSLGSSRRNVTAIKRKRSKCSDFTKKLADARREFQKKYEKTKPDRSTLKMIDLIFYNPATNPMESKNKSDKKETSLQNKGSVQETEEDIDEPQPMDYDSNSQSNDINGTNQRMPVPQVKIGLNGEIILDEKSVIIETTEAKKGREDLLKNSVPIFEDRGSRVNYYRGKTRKTRDWTDFETKRFYKALNTIGPDFSLMQKYFPKRSRMELKNKFKREERLNRSLIDKALINPSEFDMTQLEKDLAVEKRAEEEELEMKMSKGIKEKNSSKRPRTKSSLFSREIIVCNETGENEILSKVANDHGLFRNENEKKEKEIGHILRKYLLRDMKNNGSNKSEISITETNF